MWLDEYETNLASIHWTTLPTKNDWMSKNGFSKLERINGWVNMSEYETNIETSFQQNNISYEQWLDMKQAFDRETFSQTSE